MKVAIYARYSSDLQNEASTEDQIQVCQERIKREGWSLYNCYTDHAASGSNMMRPGIQMLMLDAAAGKFDVILSEALDRLSRDQQDIAGIYKRAQFAGVTIITLSEGEISNLHIGLKGTMNAIFLKDLAEKTRRGLGGRIEKGKSGGGLTYGYDVVKMFDKDGEPIRGERKINEAQAAIVRRIFQEYISGKSPKAIAVQLNRENIPCPSGKEWGPTTIYGNRKRGTGILNNELYIGQLIWNKQRYVKDPDTGRRNSRLNPESQWIKKDVPEFRIVDQETWEKAKLKQRIIAEDEPGKFWKKKRPSYLLSSLLKCGACGSGFSKISKDHCGCSKARNKGTCANLLTIRQDHVEAAVVHALQHHLMEPEIVKDFCAEYARRMNEFKIQRNAEIAGYKAELKKLEARKTAIIDALAEGYNTPEMKEEFNAGAERMAELRRLIETAQEEPVLLHPNMSHHYHKAVTNLVRLMDSDSTRNEAAIELRRLIDRIELVPNEAGSALNMELYGDLAGILTIATNQAKPLKDNNNLVVQTKLVAGAHSSFLKIFRKTLIYKGNMIGEISKKRPYQLSYKSFS